MSKIEEMRGVSPYNVIGTVTGRLKSSETHESNTPKEMSDSAPRYTVLDRPVAGGEFTTYEIVALDPDFNVTESMAMSSNRQNAELIARLLCAHEDKQEETTLQGNAIVVVTPYKYGAAWVFDDPAVGLSKEALVAGIPDILEDLLQQLGIPMESAERGVTLTFSPFPFPGHQRRLVQTGEPAVSGTWYETRGSSGERMEGWLCPALFKYLPIAPETIYAMVQEIQHPPLVQQDKATKPKKASKRAKEEEDEPRHTPEELAKFAEMWQRLQGANIRGDQHPLDAIKREIEDAKRLV